MNETQSPPNKSKNWIRLVARIWSAPVILVTFFIAFGNIWSWLTNGAADPYAVEKASTIESLAPLLMLISTIGLALAWRWEKFGGGFSLFVTAGVFIVLLIRGGTPGNSANLLIPYLLSLVILVPGILFLIYGIRSTKS
jgi:hypothetical protein